MQVLHNTVPGGHHTLLSHRGRDVLSITETPDFFHIVYGAPDDDNFRQLHFVSNPPTLTINGATAAVTTLSRSNALQELAAVKRVIACVHKATR